MDQTNSKSKIQRKAILNGANKHPGALSVMDETGTLVSLKFKTLKQRKVIADSLLSVTDLHGKVGQSSGLIASPKHKIVYRHLRNNDIVLINRQPTLHKVSIMAHRVKVQARGNVIRLHYANCNSYNADFDGDEINLHFPQSEIARAEAYTIAATPMQYISPRHGAPLRGLMQDHVVSSVLLTKRDTFLTKDEYVHLLFSCMVSWNPELPIALECPAIIKPKPLWTGKQVVSILCVAKIK
ncbi:hypothetical protein RFI_03083 [Reticulomyxa filosa]|uniref:DNA-directed RNA polymerase n=1 Tax=Reticulomyxa filosa TaxID=46433 RepID=X6P7H7_RETFI|nr:hypothetical protein RFI_03083 [Reticulomyxa filosa]|eukprot:ETO34014.1 hypothetical protein RFI_03083 [Reticulomyxa filosa]